MRTGDTPAKERQSMQRRPPDLLITTPESLYLMLTSNAADTLANVETVIVDEIHALAATKRGAHLAVSLERLEEMTARPPQRIGLSATQRPLAEVARFLGGWSAPGTPRDVAIVDAGISKPLEIDVVIPVEDMTDLAAATPPARADIYGAPRGSRGPAADQHLAVDLPAHPRADPRPPLDDRVLQRPPAGRAAGRQAQRAVRRADGRRRRRVRRVARRPGQGAPRLARPRAAGRRRGRAQARRPARHRGDEQPRARHRHGRRRPRRPGRVTGCRVAVACSGSAVPATRSASRAGGRSTPSIAATCSRRRWSPDG